jgi:hypothetical protein
MLNTSNKEASTRPGYDENVGFGEFQPGVVPDKGNTVSYNQDIPIDQQIETDANIARASTEGTANNTEKEGVLSINQ